MELSPKACRRCSDYGGGSYLTQNGPEHRCSGPYFMSSSLGGEDYIMS
jgi:hypothetical protein